MAKLLRPFAGDKAEKAAERLIHRFGGLGRALGASPDQLAEALEGDRALAEALAASRALIEAGLREEIARAPVAIDDPNFQDYLRLLIGKQATERLHATFVAHDWGYLGDDLIAEGAPGHVEGNMRLLLLRAFEIGAHGIILAHNHPSQSAEPSAADIALTRRVAALTQSVGIPLLDHLIVSGHAVVSMRERGLL